MKYAITAYRKVTEPESGQTYNLTENELYTFITKKRPKIKQKKYCTAWTPTQFEPNYRKASHAKEMSCLVLDVDQKELIESLTKGDQNPEMNQRMKEIISTPLRTIHENPNRYEQYTDIIYDVIRSHLATHEIGAIMHTSWSHSPIINRFRIVFPLRRPIPAQEEIWKPLYRAACSWLHETFSFHGTLTDSSTCDPSRAFYAAYDDFFFRADHIKGEFFDWEKLGNEQQVKEAAELERKRQEIRNRLEMRKSHTKHIDGKHATFSDYRNYMKDLLKYDAISRHKLATDLGCRIVGNRAERFTCPACLRKDATYFYIEPTTATSLFCGHVNSCGDKSKPRYFSPGYIAEYFGLL
tara:strand:- start:1845 stop:2903 length:1059 start_codon:yes stop_codon:yes gene_type:complete